MKLALFDFFVFCWCFAGCWAVWAGFFVRQLSREVWTKNGMVLSHHPIDRLFCLCGGVSTQSLQRCSCKRWERAVRRGFGEEVAQYILYSASPSYHQKRTVSNLSEQKRFRYSW